MQRQQEREHKRARRSWGELLAAWLILLLGFISAVYFFPPRNLMGFVFFLQSSSCFLGGFFSLLRFRDLARGATYLAACCWVGLAADQLWAFRNIGISIILPVVIGFLTIATALFVLGRWLGRQEDNEIG